MFRLFISAIFFIISAGAIVPGLNAQGLAQPQVIKLQRFRKALWKVHVNVKGKEGDFLFDTGGGVTLLTDEFSQGIDCKFWGRNTGYNMFGKRADGPHCDDVRITAGGVELTPVSVGKIDFADQFPGDKAPDGMLSLDAFDGKVVTIDQANAQLIIETDKSLAKRTRAMKELPMRLVRDCSGRCLNAFVSVPTSAGATWLILDSAAGGVSLISRDHASLFGLDPDKKVQDLKYQIAPGIDVDGPVMIADMIMDGNLGQPFMSKYTITIDAKRGRLWLEKT